MTTPYVGFSNDTLAKGLRIKRGDRIACPHCHALHEVRGGKDTAGVESDLLLFYRCGDKTYLAGVDGRCVNGLKADVAGEL